MRLLTADGVAWAIMLAAGEWYLGAFMLAIGGGEVAAGLIVTLPLAVGAFIQLLGPWAVAHLGSHKRWVILCVTLQACALAPLYLGALLGWMPPWSVFVLAMIYFAGGLGSAGPWTHWAGTIVPRRVRPKYFARRNRAIQVGHLVGMGAAFFVFGFYPAVHTGDLTAFVVLFGIATACRFISVLILARTNEPEPLPADHRVVPPWSVINRIIFAPAPTPRPGDRFPRSDLRVLRYMLVAHITVMVGSPFCGPYVMGQLEHSAADWTVLMACSMIGKMLAAPLWGLFAQRFGANRLLWIGAIGILPQSIWWIPSTDFGYFMLIMALGGALWGSWELSTFLLQYERVRPEERSSVLIAFTFATAAAQTSGAIIGGILLDAYSDSREGYFLIFLLSGVLRVASIGVLLTVIPLRAARTRAA